VCVDKTEVRNTRKRREGEGDMCLWYDGIDFLSVGCNGLARADRGVLWCPA